MSLSALILQNTVDYSHADYRILSGCLCLLMQRRQGWLTRQGTLSCTC